MQYIIMLSPVKLIFLIPLFISSIQAQVSLSPIIVTGTRYEQSQDDEVSQVSVITQEMLKNSLDSDAARLIARQPGIDASTPRGRSGVRPVIQGFSGERVLVVVDDIPQYGEQFDLKSIPIADLEQVEILRGGASALYGNQAMAGVIHLRTKKVQEGFQARVQGLGSNDSSYQGQVHLKSSMIKLYHQQTKDSTDPDPRLPNAQDSKTTRSQQGVSLKLDELVPLNLELHWRQSLSKSHFQSLVSGNSRDNASRNKDQNYGVKLGLDKTNWRTHLHFQQQKQDEELNLNDNPQTRWREQTRLNESQLQSYEVQTQGMWDRHVLTLGASHQRESFLNDTRLQFSPFFIKEDREVDQNRHQSAFYIQNQTLFERFDIVAGLRVQDDSLDRLRLAPKLASRITLYETRDESLIMRPSIGLGYRYPTLRERHALIDHRSFANYLVRGNENLRPEQAWSAQWGFDYTRRDQTYRLNGFFNSVQDLIQTKRNEDQTQYQELIYQNVSRARTYGLEASATFQIKEISSLQLNYTLLKTQNRELNKTLPFRPQHIMTASLVNQWNRFKFSSDLVWRSSEYIDEANLIQSQSFATTDLRASYRLSKQAHLLARVDNLFDITRRPINATTELDARPSSGRQIFFGIEVTL
jgi:outer membrane receptor for ferrienterochelin and colicins